MAHHGGKSRMEEVELLVTAHTQLGAERTKCTAYLCPDGFLCTYTVRNPLHAEWHHPQWPGSSGIN